MKLYLIILPCLFNALALKSQIVDDFSDGDLTNGPSWFGDIKNFKVNEQGELQLAADSAGRSTIYIATNLASNDQVVWTLDCYLDFDPSPSNFFSIYLGLDTPDIDLGNGVALELGEANDQDQLRLLKIENGVRTMIKRGRTVLAINPSFRIKIEKVDELWRVFTSSAGSNGAFIEEFNLHMDDLQSIKYFAINCTYTGTRTDKFRFDNLQIAPASPEDSEPPFVTDLEVVNNHQLIIQFNEDLDAVSANDPAHYQLDPGENPIQSVELLADPTLVQLDLRTELMAGTRYLLGVLGVKDLANNVSSDQYSFTYQPEVIIEPYDLLINEIFDDPSPNIGLPEAEYIELLVRREGLPLDQLQLVIGTRVVSLPEIIPDEGDLLVIHDQEDSDLFLEIPGSIGVENLPALVNTGNDIQIMDQNGQIIDAISYDDTWYRNSSKEEGGWSLELINPQAPCNLAANWSASKSLTGGTPGRENSIVDTTSSSPEPIITNLLALDSQTLRISLNKSYLNNLPNDQFEISEGISVSSVTVLGANRTEIILQLTEPLQRSKNYTLTILDLKDCEGQLFTNLTQEILIPEKPAPGDLVINEVLFDPYPGGEDFVEIHNRSDKVILLSELFIANNHNSNVVNLTQPFIIKPGSYIVITPNPIDIQTRYQVDHPEWLIKNRLPSFSNDEGNITLYTDQGANPIVLDAFDYSEAMHHALLKNKEGVSLERIAPNAPTQQASSWHSASESAGFATPTAMNSQSHSQINSTSRWSITPKTFSPDGDGFDDYLLLSYAGMDPGTIIHAKVYDAAGRMIHYLANNHLGSSEGFLQWDGTTDSGRKAPIGIYTILIKTFGIDGTVELQKETCVVAARLN